MEHTEDVKNHAGAPSALNVGLGDFTDISDGWPRYAETVRYLRKDGTTGIGAAGDNGVYFHGWGMAFEPHSNIIGWKREQPNAALTGSPEAQP